jgi:xanthine phosphoribosyltransferase
MDLEVLRDVATKEGRWLVIDDLVDTGSTAKVVRQLVPSAFIACTYAKPIGEATTDIFARSISQDTWVTIFIHHIVIQWIVRLLILLLFSVV